MARDFNGTSDTVKATGVSTPLPTAYPLTISSWFNPGAADNGVIVGLSSDTTSSRYVLLMSFDDVGTRRIRSAQRGDGEGENAFVGTGSMSQDTWHHVAVVHSTTTSRELFLDGVGDGTDVTSSTFPTLTTVNYTTGVFDDNGSDSSFVIGGICQCAIWDAALTGSEILSLSNGVNPNMIRPTSLIFYAPLYGASPEPELSGNSNNLIVNGTTITNHAPVVRSVPNPDNYSLSPNVNQIGPISGNVQIAGRQVLSSRTVHLYDRQSGDLLQTTTTDLNGEYIFNQVDGSNNKEHYVVVLDND